MTASFCVSGCEGAVPGAPLQAPEIELVAAEAQHRRGVGGGALVPAPAPQNGLHARQQLLQVERLRQVVVAARLEPLHAVVDARLGGEEEHRRLHAFGARRLADREAVEPREHDVEEDEILPAAADHLERRASLADDRDAVALGFEILGDALGEMLFVLDHQNGARLGHEASSPSSAWHPG